jgi:carboxyl-terminal processing protease
LEKIQHTIFDYNSNDTIKLSKKYFPLDLDESAIDRVWVKRMKYDILEDISKISTNLDSLKLNFSTLEKTSKAKIFESNLCKLNSFLNTSKGLEYELQNIFF